MEPITYIVNSSLSTGVVPHGMKIAKVIPIFKNGDRTHFNNYRPISILYGFRPGHSTIHPIIHALNQTAVENDTPTHNLTIATFLDLSKAFDTISHEKLLQKLNNMGIRGLANDWFRSYLSNRKQYMEIHNIHDILIYINDIHNSTSIQMMCFADDTTCIYSSPSVPELYDNMNRT